MHFLKSLILIVVFGLMYGNAEVVFRAIMGDMKTVNGQLSPWWCLQGWTSLWLMAVGGLTGFTLGLLNTRNSNYKWPRYQVRIISGVVIIYAIEFFSGLILNTWLKLNLWNYTDPLNVYHQITGLYLPIWLTLSIFGQWLDDYLRFKLYQGTNPGSVVKAFVCLFRQRD